MNIEHRINDKLVKFFSVPLIAICFPNITNFIINSRYTLPLLLMQYCCFIVVVYIIWEGNIRIVMMIKTKMNIDNISYHRYLLAILCATFMYTGFTAVCLLKIWTLLFKENDTTAHILLNATLLLICISILITILYENYLLNRKKLSALSKVERMSMAKTQAELSILKSQIDPHFLFNSFNTLSHLISSNPVNAKLYNDTLAKVYQFILINKQKDLVFLREEIEFVSNYFYLLSIRFGEAIKMCIEITDIEAEELLIPPISLQILIENAIKHNAFDYHNPLIISVRVSLNQIIVSNRISHRTILESSSRTGLINLENRYKLITNKSISIDSNQFFSVKLPVINL
jgi:sensor histidine kinase YesM